MGLFELLFMAKLLLGAATALYPFYEAQFILPAQSKGIGPHKGIIGQEYPHINGPWAQSPYK